MLSLKNTPLILLLFIISCASPQKRLSKKDFDGAFKSALKELKKGKATNQNRQVLEKALGQILTEDLKEMRTLSTSESVQNWEKALKKSNKTQEKILDTEIYLNQTFAAEKKELQDLDQQNQTTLFSHYFDNGQHQLAQSISSGYKHYAQSAYSNLIAAKKYSSGPNSIDSLINLCYQYGQIIYWVEADATFAILHNWEIDRQFDKVTGYSGHLPCLVHCKLNSFAF